MDNYVIIRANSLLLADYVITTVKASVMVADTDLQAQTKGVLNKLNFDKVT
ncbi:hypothetical protein T12_4473 [Trichinella patagoniensis]|uniref:Uncharacterized protein n=1 Tax=Trichinella patagoniensis TaxID=990121 RepID=A0A0V0YT12_9BILA|nr:hypothetical protein T12_4473 [Trichinella patagoniensis]